MKTVFFIKNDWNDDTYSINDDEWVNDGRCMFNTLADVEDALAYHNMMHPDDAGRVSVSRHEVEGEA